MNPYSEKPYVVDVEEHRPKSTHTDSILREVFKRVQARPVAFLVIALVLFVAQSPIVFQQLGAQLTDNEKIAAGAIGILLSIVGSLLATAAAVLIFSKDEFGSFGREIGKGALRIITKGVPYFLLLLPYYLITAVGLAFFVIPKVLQSLAPQLEGVDITLMALVGGVVMVLGMATVFFITIRTLLFLPAAVLGFPRAASTSVALTRGIFWRVVLHWVFLVAVGLLVGVASSILAVVFGAVSPSLAAGIPVLINVFVNILVLGYITVLFETIREESTVTLPLLHRDSFIYKVLGGIGVIALLFLVFGWLVGS